MDYTAIQGYLEQLVPPRPPELAAMERYAADHDFPIIGPVAGQLCYQTARLIGAQRVYELGSGYGYSTAWFARAVQEAGGGEVHHVVWDEALSAMARRHLAALGYGDIVRYHVGEAVAALRATDGPFDVIFMDIDKQGYPDALEVIDGRLRAGGVLIVDNVLWSGKIADDNASDPTTAAIRRMNDTLARDARYVTTIAPVRDGVLIAQKK